MTHPEKLQAVKEKCVEVNPAIVECRYADDAGNVIHEETDYREVRLSDVMLALDEKRDKVYVGMDMQGWFSIAWHRQAQWNLRKDSLVDQSEETISFLYDLLV